MYGSEKRVIEKLGIRPTQLFCVVAVLWCGRYFDTSSTSVVGLG